ncbi:MAG: ABC transporter substrate-binding protein [Planctomycetota bacterium]|jgi:branched-chain amino acid transport system substrate-binding protein|nr:ABC transporter substrate-binding protein [Planctomycetota bacterium]
MRFLALLLLVAAPCLAAEGPAPEGTIAEAAGATPVFSGTITLGATFPLSGDLETYGQSAFYGAVTRIKLINAAGGVNGKRLVLEWRDNGSDPAQAARDVEDLVANHRVPAVLGPLLSEAVLAVRPVAEALEVVIVSPMAAIDAIAKQDPWVFRACFNNSAQAEALVRFQMEKYGARSCGILYDPRYGFCAELADIFERKMAERGGAVVGKLPFTGGDGARDYRTPLLELAGKNPDFIMVVSYALEATEIVREAKKSGVPIRLCGPHTWDNELVFDGSGTRLGGACFASAMFEQGFSYRPFRVFFEAMEDAGMDNPDAQAACAYDAVTLLARALETGETPRDIKKGLLAIKRLALATGRTSIAPDGNAIKPVLIRIVERVRDRMVPVYAERYDP